MLRTVSQEQEAPEHEGFRVLHVLPMDLARGSQIHARALRDTLDQPERRHLLLTLFNAPDRGLDPDLSLGLRPGLLRRWGFDPRAAIGLRRAVHRLRPAVIVAHGSEALKYSILARRSGCRLVYYAIGVATPEVHNQPTRTLYRWLYHRADLIAGVSAEVVAECNQLLAVPTERLLLAPNGRDPGVYQPATGRDRSHPPTLAYIGHLTAEKRPELMIEVTSQLRALGRELRSVMVGDGPLAGQLRHRAANAGVEMLGVRTDVAAVMRECDLLLFPSGYHGEGMPGVLIEAGLAGLPVVATDVPGVSTIVDDGETGCIVPVDDLAAMVEAVDTLLSDPDRRTRMGRAARNRCESQFSLAASAAIWGQAIERLSDG
jgi:glycosyltransferase involved in cell wall biosynthesis